jgi:hypothetical protein
MLKATREGIAKTGASRAAGTGLPGRPAAEPRQFIRHCDYLKINNLTHFTDENQKTR